MLIEVRIVKNIKVLIVDDEENIISFLKMGLEADGFKVFTADNGNTAVELAINIKPDIIILDVMLPELNGYEVCAKIKERIHTNIIMLTARDDIDDRIKGLEIGADDYMIKPFSYRELVARINARLRDKKENPIVLNKINKIGEFLVNKDGHEIKYQDRVLELSLTEYKLLICLLEHKGIVLSKSTILDRVWGYDFYGDENVVEVYIRYLRNKLGDREHKIIQTIRGAGYKVNINVD